MNGLIPYLLGVDSRIQVNHIHCETDQVADGYTKFDLDMLV